MNKIANYFLRGMRLRRRGFLVALIIDIGAWAIIAKCYLIQVDQQLQSLKDQQREGQLSETGFLQQMDHFSIVTPGWLSLLTLTAFFGFLPAVAARLRDLSLPLLLTVLWVSPPLYILLYAKHYILWGGGFKLLIYALLAATIVLCILPGKKQPVLSDNSLA